MKRSTVIISKYQTWLKKMAKDEDCKDAAEKFLKFTKQIKKCKFFTRNLQKFAIQFFAEDDNWHVFIFVFRKRKVNIRVILDENGLFHLYLVYLNHDRNNSRTSQTLNLSDFRKFFK